MAAVMPGTESSSRSTTFSKTFRVARAHPGQPDTLLPVPAAHLLHGGGRTRSLSLVGRKSGCGGKDDPAAHRAGVWCGRDRGIIRLDGPRGARPPAAIVASYSQQPNLAAVAAPRKATSEARSGIAGDGSACAPAGGAAAARSRRSFGRSAPIFRTNCPAGMQQRIGLGPCTGDRSCGLLLMDEPFSALDARTRENPPARACSVSTPRPNKNDPVRHPRSR